MFADDTHITYAGSDLHLIPSTESSLSHDLNSIQFNLFISTLYLKSTVSLRPQIAKANRGGRSNTQSVVKMLIIRLQQYYLKYDIKLTLKS